MKALWFTASLLFGASCATTPRHEERSEEVPVSVSAVDTRKDARADARRLQDLRAQLESSNPAVVAWAAWRCTDERIRGVEFELRRAAVRWAERTANLDEERAGEAALDALVQLGVTISAEELEPWRERARWRGAPLVLASRISPPPVDWLRDVFDDGKPWNAAKLSRHEFAGNLLAAAPTPEVVKFLVDRAEMRLDVHGRKRMGKTSLSRPRNVQRADLPRCFDYVFSPATAADAAVCARGPVDVLWTRISPEQICARTDPVIESAGTYAVELLAWIADGRTSAPDASRELIAVAPVTVDAQDDALAYAALAAAHSVARARWIRVVDALIARGLLAEVDARRDDETLVREMFSLLEDGPRTLPAGTR